MSTKIQSLRPTNYAALILRQLSITLLHLCVWGRIRVNFCKSFVNDDLGFFTMVATQDDTIVAQGHHLVHHHSRRI